MYMWHDVSVCMSMHGVSHVLWEKIHRWKLASDCQLLLLEATHSVFLLGRGFQWRVKRIMPIFLSMKCIAWLELWSKLECWYVLLKMLGRSDNPCYSFKLGNTPGRFFPLQQLMMTPGQNEGGNKHSHPLCAQLSQPSFVELHPILVWITLQWIPFFHSGWWPGRAAVCLLPTQKIPCYEWES